MNSSTTTSAPAAPKPPPNIMSMASCASLQRHRDDDALAGGETIGLDHDRRALRADIGLGGIRIAEALIGRGRNVVGLAEILGEALGAFEPGGGLARPERLDAGGSEIVDDARRRAARPGRPRRNRPCWSWQNAITAAWSAISSATHSASLAMPALPGAHQSLVSSGDAAIFHASACSRPPEPRRRMFMKDQTVCARKRRV